MRTKLLNEDQDRWLFANFPDMGNKELAKKLTEMIKSENKEKVKLLQLELQVANSISKRTRICRQINRLMSFQGVTPGFIKMYARRLGCGKKSAVYIARTNRQNAYNAYIFRLQLQAETVTSYKAWFRTFSLNDTKVIRLASEQKLQSLKSSICGWNSDEGKRMGMMLVPEFHKEQLLAKIAAKLYVQI